MKINVATDILSVAIMSTTADGTSAATMNWKVCVHRNY